GGRVAVWTGRVETQVQLTVTDTGQGSAGDFLPYVFERFRQETGTGLQVQTGLGLGLTLVRELVEMHGGTVQAESGGEGRGARFTVALPVPAVLMVATPSAPTGSVAPASIGIPVREPAGRS